MTLQLPNGWRHNNKYLSVSMCGTNCTEALSKSKAKTNQNPPKLPFWCTYQTLLTFTHNNNIQYTNSFDHSWPIFLLCIHPNYHYKYKQHYSNVILILILPLSELFDEMCRDYFCPGFTKVQSKATSINSKFKPRTLTSKTISNYIVYL